MYILMISITPLFPDHDMGGGQKHLRNITLPAPRRHHQLYETLH